jgi:putative FmdB family regulatory protein
VPIYAYRCESCGFQKDALQKLSDAPLTVCPECGQPTLKKQVTAAGFQLKGSGWYVTDFRDNQAKSKAAEAPVAAKDDKAAAAPVAEGAAKSSDAPAPAAAADKPAASSGESAKAAPAPAPSGGGTSNGPSSPASSRGSH